MIKPRVKVYVSLETGECTVSGVVSYPIPKKDWWRLFHGVPASSRD